MTRREFLQTIATSVWALASSAAAFIVGSYLSTPLWRTKREILVDLGPVALLSERPLSKHAYSYVVVENGRARTVEKSALIVAQSGAITVFSSICTHLSCELNVNERDRKFTCPCHHGVFAVSGVPLSGPPNRPLRQLPHVIRNQHVYVKELV